MAARRLVLAAALIGCSYPTDETPYPGQCAPFGLLSSRPAIGERDVPTNAVIELAFSDYPDSEIAGLETIVVTSGFFRKTGAYNVDLVAKTVRYRPTTPFEPNLEYTVSVQPHIRSLQGCTSGRLEQRSFRTGAGPAPDAPARPVVRFETVLAIFAARCAGATCHRRDDGGPGGGGDDGAAPPRGLSLDDERAYDDLVGVRSAELSDLLRVAPRDPARSYLLRKLLPGRDPDRPMPTVFGQRMPPGGFPPGGAGGVADPIRAIADWIDAGAPR